MLCLRLASCIPLTMCPRQARWTQPRAMMDACASSMNRSTLGSQKRTVIYRRGIPIGLAWMRSKLNSASHTASRGPSRPPAATGVMFAAGTCKTSGAAGRRAVEYHCSKRGPEVMRVDIGATMAFDRGDLLGTSPVLDEGQVRACFAKRVLRC